MTEATEKIVKIQDLHFEVSLWINELKFFKDEIKIFNHLPERGAAMLFEAIEQLNSVAPQEIVEAQNKFVAIITELRDQGRL